MDGFGACCNPMNLTMDADGNLYTSQSGLGRVKCYTTEGKVKSLTGTVDTTRFERASHLASSCSNMAICTTPDAKTVYVMDYKNRQIRVMGKK